jgi:hypothetical protein
VLGVWANSRGALREVQIAKGAWLETCRARKKPIPKPRYRPAIYAIAT